MWSHRLKSSVPFWYTGRRDFINHRPGYFSCKRVGRCLRRLSLSVKSTETYNRNTPPSIRSFYRDPLVWRTIHGCENTREEWTIKPEPDTVVVGWHLHYDVLKTRSSIPWNERVLRTPSSGNGTLSDRRDSAGTTLLRGRSDPSQVHLSLYGRSRPTRLVGLTLSSVNSLIW